DADFEMLERAVNTDGDSFAKLFGITTISRPTSNSADFPYTLSLLAEKVTGVENANWGKVQPFLDRLTREQGVNIKKSDNRYHSATKTGKRSVSHKYSDDLLELIRKMRAGQEYKFQL
ncbi:MAG: hypothetical protein ABSF53_21985, partial [Terracidiphilus sp.]